MSPRSRFLSPARAAVLGALALSSSTALAQDNIVEKQRLFYWSEYYQKEGMNFFSELMWGANSGFYGFVAPGFLALTKKPDSQEALLLSFASDAITAPLDLAPGTGVVLGPLVDKLKDDDGEFPRLAKRRTSDKVYLQADDGRWCQVPHGTQLSSLKDDEFEVFDRGDLSDSDIAGAGYCPWLDGFYKEEGSPTVWFLYSQEATEPAFLGAGLGTAACKFADEARWKSFVKTIFELDRESYNMSSENLFQRTLNHIPDNSNLLMGRSDKGTCTADTLEKRAHTVRYTEKPVYERTIRWPLHYERTGHGWGMIISSGAQGNATAERFIDGAAFGAVANLGMDFSPFPFTGTVWTTFSEATRDTEGTLPTIARRKTSAKTYLRYDSGDWCKIKDDRALSLIQGGWADCSEDGCKSDLTLTPWVTDSSELVESDKECVYPDGFYLSTSGGVVYLLFSDDRNDPTWNDIGFGDKYCAIPNEESWAALITKAGGDWTDAQFSLHRMTFDPAGTHVPFGDEFLTGRTQTTCPSDFVKQLPKDGRDVPAQPGEFIRTDAGAISLIYNQRQLRHVENMDVYNGCGIGGAPSREISDAAAAYMKKGAALTAAADCKALRLKPGNEVVKTKAGTFYIVDNAMERRQVDSMAVLNGCSIDMGLVRSVSDAVANAVPAGAAMTTADDCRKVRQQPLVDANLGTLPRAVRTKSGHVYAVDRTTKTLRWIVSGRAWEACTVGDTFAPTDVDGWAVGMMPRGEAVATEQQCRAVNWYD